MSDSLGSSPIADPVSAHDLMGVLAEHIDADVTVNVAGTLVDLSRVSYDTDREKVVLCLHPDDADDVLRKLFRRMSTVDRAPDHATEEGR